jgi:CubicO group peptidase (beta-lactamase class C family)
MISTAMDYAVFCQMYLNGGVYGGTRIISQETVEKMTSPFFLSGGDSEPERGVRVGYGYGWSVSSNGVFSHTGSDGTGAWVDPREDLIVLVFTQTPRGRNPRGKFLEMVMAAILD